MSSKAKLRRQQDDDEGKDVSAERELRDSRRRDGNRRDVRGRDDHEEREFSMTNVAQALGRTTADQVRAAVPPAPANRGGANDDFVRTRCPLCGGQKGDSKFVLCRDHHGEYQAAAKAHGEVIAAMGNGAVVDAIMAGTMDPAAVRVPSEQAYALRLALGAMATYEEEVAAAEAAYSPIGRAVTTRFDAVRTGVSELDNALRERCRADVWAKTPGAKEAYYGMLNMRSRLAAARLLIADCERDGITPGTMLTEPPAQSSASTETPSA